MNSIFPKNYDKGDKIQAIMFAVVFSVVVGVAAASVMMLLGHAVGWCR